LPHSVRLGDLPGIGRVIIHGVVRAQQHSTGRPGAGGAVYEGLVPGRNIDTTALAVYMPK
jgi:hypothetical protein